MVSANTVAIIGGTGQEGKALALRGAAAGRRVIIGSRELERARAAAAEIAAKVPGSQVQGLGNLDAARQADTIVVTVPPNGHRNTFEGLRGFVDGKVVIDTTARVDPRAPRPPAPPAAAQDAQSILGPQARVVAAFQNVPAHVLAQLGREVKSDAFVCSDDAEAKEVVMALAEAAGMRAFDAGPLANAIVVEGLTALIIALNKRYKSRSGGIRVTGLR